MTFQEEFNKFLLEQGITETFDVPPEHEEMVRTTMDACRSIPNARAILDETGFRIEVSVLEDLNENS